MKQIEHVTCAYSGGRISGIRNGHVHTDEEHIYIERWNRCFFETEELAKKNCIVPIDNPYYRVYTITTGAKTWYHRGFELKGV